MYLPIGSAKVLISFPPNPIGKIIISDGSLVMEYILHQPAGSHHILFNASEERFVQGLGPILGMLTILSFFFTWSSVDLSFY